MKKIKIVHNRKNCTGCHSCVQIAPQNWMIDVKDGKSSLIGAKEKNGLYIGEAFLCDKISNEMAAKACPMKIIRIEK